MSPITVAGHTFKLREQPPPHLPFLGSQMQSMDEHTDPLRMLACTGGLARICVESIDGEEVEAAKLPRDLDTLEVYGRGFVMLAFELVGSHEALGELFMSIITAYAGVSGNPS